MSQRKPSTHISPVMSFLPRSSRGPSICLSISASRRTNYAPAERHGSVGNPTAVHTKNFVRVAPVELARQERYFADAMFAIILSLRCSIRQGFRTGAAIQAEILALRHQLLVLQRSVRTHKVRLTASDRFLWVWLSRLWREWRSALLFVKTETVIAWHRRGFRLYWAGRVAIHKAVLPCRERSMTHSNDEPGESPLGSATHSWGTAETGICRKRVRSGGAGTPRHSE